LNVSASALSALVPTTPIPPARRREKQSITVARYRFEPSASGR
jgi:hypothetical protein